MAAVSARRRRGRDETDYLLRDAPEQQTGEPAVAAAADDNEIDLPVLGCCNDLFGGVTKRRRGRDPHRTLRRAALRAPSRMLSAGARASSVAGSGICSTRAYSAKAGSTPWGETGDDRQQDEFSLVPVRQISGEIGRSKRG
jgi:hypothetical protein